MAAPKFTVGERVEVRCYHRQGNQIVHDWLPGVVTQVDHRMAAVQFELPVFTNDGWAIPDRILWSAHGSPNIRRPA